MGSELTEILACDRGRGRPKAFDGPTDTQLIVAMVAAVAILNILLYIHIYVEESLLHVAEKCFGAAVSGNSLCPT